MINLSTVDTGTNMVDVSSPESPVTLLTHSRACFEITLRPYYLRHGFEYSDTCITHHLQVLAFIALDELRSTDP